SASDGYTRQALCYDFSKFLRLVMKVFYPHFLIIYLMTPCISAWCVDCDFSKNGILFLVKEKI
ncbi:MAG: hypothetical protein K2O80_06430, partial [Helicobacter apodemus]|nr:hypothetical protein [Helicobacter apodemus]